jgi:hypothetical protein
MPFNRWSPDQWISQCYAIGCFKGLTHATDVHNAVIRRMCTPTMSSKLRIPVFQDVTTKETTAEFNECRWPRNLNIRLCSRQYSEGRAEFKKDIKIELSFVDPCHFTSKLIHCSAFSVFIFYRNSYICKKFMDFEFTLRECKMEGQTFHFYFTNTKQRRQLWGRSLIEVRLIRSCEESGLTPGNTKRRQKL